MPALPDSLKRRAAVRPSRGRPANGRGRRLAPQDGPCPFAAWEQTKHHPTTETERVCYGSTVPFHAVGLLLCNLFSGCAPFAICTCRLRGLYGLSLLIGILVRWNFITQVASDVLFSKPVENTASARLPWLLLNKRGWLGLFAAAPILFPQRPFAGFLRGHVPVRRGGRPA